MGDAPLARLGAELRRRRLDAGLTQTELAGRVPGYDRESTRTIVSKCERGHVARLLVRPSRRRADRS